MSVEHTYPDVFIYESPTEGGSIKTVYYTWLRKKHRGKWYKTAHRMIFSGPASAEHLKSFNTQVYLDIILGKVDLSLVVPNSPYVLYPKDPNQESESDRVRARYCHNSIKE